VVAKQGILGPSSLLFGLSQSSFDLPDKDAMKGGAVAIVPVEHISGIEQRRLHVGVVNLAAYKDDISFAEIHAILVELRSQTGFLGLVTLVAV
jgi:hypothetical protein